MSMLCNNNRVRWVIFHFIKLLHSKYLSSFLQNFSMRCFRCGKQYTVQSITEYVGLFFILSNCSIQSTFLLFCKILVCVVFAVANNTPYRSPLPGASITFLPLSQLRLVSFYLVLIFFFFSFFFFFFLLSC